jgi:murein DD-endopeptidase MepM/ murein hydrolase activator NlpD
MLIRFWSKYKLPLVGLLILSALFANGTKLSAQDEVYADGRSLKRPLVLKASKFEEPEPVDFDEMSSLSAQDLRRKLTGILPNLDKKARRRLFQQLQDWRPDWFEHWEDSELFPDSTSKDTMPQRLRFEILEEGEELVYSWHGGGLTYGYGPRNGHMHKGWDTPLEIGDTIVSLMNGVVRYAKFNHSGYGNCVMVRHFNGLETLYGHLDRIDVEQGDLVVAGEALGLGGNTGKSTGPHLHFEVRYAGFALDPALIMNWTDRGPKVKTTVLEINKSQLSAEKGGESTHGSHGSHLTNNQYHIVRSGETLSSIARKYHTSLSKLKKVNRLRNADFIREGQRIRVR